MRKHQINGRIKLDDLQQLPLVQVTFLDHITNETHPIKVKALGYELHYDSEKLILISWLPLDEDEATTKSNWEICTIVSTCIVEIRKLTLGKKRRLKK